MPTCARNGTTSSFVVDVLAVELDLPGDTRQMSMVSFIRFRQRRKVDLPQPDGTDHRDHLVLRDVQVDSAIACLFAVEHVDVSTDIRIGTRTLPTVLKSSSAGANHASRLFVPAYRSHRRDGFAVSSRFLSFQPSTSAARNVAG